MSITDKWTPNKAHEAEKVFGADDLAHPAVNYLHNIAGAVYLGGPVTGIQQPVHYDFKARRDTPNELRAYFRKLGWRRVVASPLPVEIMELEAIKALINSGTITITVPPPPAAELGEHCWSLMWSSETGSAQVSTELSAGAVLIGSSQRVTVPPVLPLIPNTAALGAKGTEPARGSQIGGSTPLVS